MFLQTIFKLALQNDEKACLRYEALYYHDLKYFYKTLLNLLFLAAINRRSDYDASLKTCSILSLSYFNLKFFLDNNTFVRVRFLPEQNNIAPSRLRRKFHFILQIPDMIIILNLAMHFLHLFKC